MIVHAARSLPKPDLWIFVCRADHVAQARIDLTLQKLFQPCIVITVDHLTEGQACTCLLARGELRTDDELHIGACDNAMTWVISDFDRAMSGARSDFLVSLGRAEEALSLLTRREQALPDNYNPPHQLARVYRSLKRWDEAAAAIERALGRAYGPRRANLMTLQIELLVAAGRKAEAKAAAAKQVEAYRALPDAQKLPEAEAAARDRLKQLE
jgi:tetratricopeptide (TPR) repeat protein